MSCNCTISRALVVILFSVGQVLAADTTIRLPGYEAVPMRYGRLNRILMRATVNGHTANLTVDTGAGLSVLDAKRAQAFGVALTGPNSPYGEYKILNDRSFRVGVIDSLKAGSMDFGRGPIALLGRGNFSLSSRLAGLDIDGLFGADILTRYKAVINCGTNEIFFKVDPSCRLHLARFALSQHFTKIPLREEVGRGFTVPCSINGHPIRLLVDTGTPLTTFSQTIVKSAGISFQGIRWTTTFSDGVARQLSVGRLNQLMIGNFRVPPQRLLATVLPTFAVEQGSAQEDGLLGVDLLASNYAIIDFDSMSLFLK